MMAGPWLSGLLMLHYYVLYADVRFHLERVPSGPVAQSVPLQVSSSFAPAASVLLALLSAF